MDQKETGDAAETMDSQEFLPFHRPSIDAEDIACVSTALRSGWLTHGPVCREFEAEFATLAAELRSAHERAGPHQAEAHHQQEGE